MNFFSGTPILCTQPESPACLVMSSKHHRARVDKSARGDGPLLLVVNRRGAHAAGNAAHVRFVRSGLVARCAGPFASWFHRRCNQHAGACRPSRCIPRFGLSEPSGHLAGIPDVPIKITANTARTWNSNGIPPGLKCIVTGDYPRPAPPVHARSAATRHASYRLKSNAAER